MSEPDGLSVFDGEPADAPRAPARSVGEGSGRLAHPAQRALAFVIDGIGTFLVATVVIVAGLAAGEPTFLQGAVVVPALAAVLCIALTALAGVTPGKAVLGLRVADAVTGRPPGLRAIPRGLVLASPPALGYGLAAVLTRLPDDGSADAGLSAAGAVALLPAALWVALLVVTAMRPQYRGLQDLAGRTVVVRR